MGDLSDSAGKPVERPLSLRALPDDVDLVIGRLLGDAREDAGLPQSAAARAIGAPQSRIGKLERGQRRLLFLEAVMLAELYDVPLDRFDPTRNAPREPTGRRRRVDHHKDL